MSTSVSISTLSFGDADYQSFRQKVQSRCGVRLGDYKSDQMRRRITTMAQQAGCPSFILYFAAMERDSTVLSGFLDRMTINVTELLRNPERFAELTGRVLPDLLARKKGAPLSAWSAGCSYGAEAYTLAMLFQEISLGDTTPRRGDGTLTWRCLLGPTHHPSQKQTWSTSLWTVGTCISSARGTVPISHHHYCAIPCSVRSP